VPRGGLHQVRSNRHWLLCGARRRKTLSARGLPYRCSRQHAALHRPRRGQAVPRGGLLQVCSRRALQGARRRQALPARGLPHGSCWWRHASLQDAWRGQTLSARGLLEVRTRRHGVLHRAWRRQALPARGLLQDGSRWRALRGARRRQALPTEGLLEVGAYRRHTPLHGARRRQALPRRGLRQVSRQTSRQCVLHAMCPSRHPAASTRPCALASENPPCAPHCGGGGQRRGAGGG
jgi:hypothetical protein